LILDGGSGPNKLITWCMFILIFVYYALIITLASNPLETCGDGHPWVFYFIYAGFAITSGVTELWLLKYLVKYL
jgi:hypothetical protein